MNLKNIIVNKFIFICLFQLFYLSLVNKTKEIMKDLSSYVDKPISELTDRCGAFWAFGTAQFEEKKVAGVTYVSLASGVICPKENAKTYITEMDIIFKNGTKQYLAENSKEQIIKNELANHECYYTGDWMEAFYMVEDYGFTKDEVYDIYRKQLVREEEAGNV